MNWDNPLSSGQMYVDNLNRHHGIDFKRDDWKSAVGYSESGAPDFHDLYLNYCKFMQSPLGQELL